MPHTSGWDAEVDSKGKGRTLSLDDGCEAERRADGGWVWDGAPTAVQEVSDWTCKGGMGAVCTLVVTDF